MTIILSLILVVVFAILGVIHLSWVFGSKWGFAESLPTNEKGERVLNPKKFDSAIVGLGLCFFALFYLIKSGLFTLDIPSWIAQYGSWIIPSIFLLRVIGDFKYIGFFKRIKETDFGKRDSKLFSPLCLGIGLIGVVCNIIAQ